MTTPNLYTVETVSTTAPHVLILAPVGHGLTLVADQMDAPLLCPLPDGDALLLEDWTDAHAQGFRVPASLVADVRSVLGVNRVTAIGEDLGAARAALPKVAAVIPGAVWPAVTLELDNGASIHLGEGDRAALHPISPDGLSVLVCWSGQTVTAECAAPAALLPELAPYFPTAAQS